MSTRRKFRIKIMQFIYAYNISKLDSKLIKLNLLNNINNIFELYRYILYIIIAVKDEAVSKLIFINNFNNIILDTNLLHNNQHNNIKLLHFTKNILLHKISNNSNITTLASKYYNDYHHDLIISLLNDIINYNYLYNSINTGLSTFEAHKKIIINIYKDIIIHNNKLHSILQDKYITWKDDICIAWKMLFNTLINVKEDTKKDFQLFDIYKDSLDKSFVIKLYQNTISYSSFFDFIIAKHLNNWRLNRIPILDKIILHMALSEFLFFTDIPIRVILNEYIEIAKMYSTDASKTFINGILDRLFKNICTLTKK